MSRKEAFEPAPHLYSCEEALARLMHNAVPVSDYETVDLFDADNRILAESVAAPHNVPASDNSAMDGYALIAADWAQDASEMSFPVSQTVFAGQVGTAIAPDTAVRIFTGAPIPAGADAVVMQELCELSADGRQVTIRHRPRSGENVRKAGEDIRTGSEVVCRGTRLQATHLGLLASVGAATVLVYRRLRVAIFFTGDELVMPGEPLPAGGVYNSNRFVLRSLLKRLGCDVTDYGIVKDSLAATRAALRDAANAHDIIITSGGVSVGDADFVKPAVEAEGELELWRIAMKPGKPLAFGKVRRTGGNGFAHFIGLPGNPVSTLVTFCVVVRPFLFGLSGCIVHDRAVMLLRAGFSQRKADFRQEFLRARINADGAVSLFDNQGSGVLTSVVWADGLIDNPAGHQIMQGDLVKFIPFSQLLN